MKIERIVNLVYNKPWCVLPSVYANIQKLIESKLAGDSLEDFLKDDCDDEGYEIIGKTAILTIEGVILPKCSGLEAMCGAFSLAQFKEDLQELGGNENVENIILNFDSPGGCVSGLAEAVDVLNQVGQRKNIYAFVGAGCMAASAAYWLASQCKAIFASKSAETGSIGVYCAVLDQSKAFEMNGLKVELFKAGEQKAMGLPGTSLSDKDKQTLQDGVDKTYKSFTAAVLSKRPRVPDSAMQGLTYETDEALPLGLVDFQQSDLNKLIDYLNAQ